MKYLFIVSVYLMTTFRPGPLHETRVVPATQELTDSLILHLIFGKVETCNPRTFERHFQKYFATVTLDSTQFSAKHWSDFERTGSTDYYIETKDKFMEGGVEKTMVILVAEGISCHACPGVCGAAVFSQYDGRWRLEHWENDIAVMGTTGYPLDEAEIREVQEGLVVILLKRGSNWQGVNERLMNVVVYEEGKFHEALDKLICFSSDNWANTEHTYPHELSEQPFSYTSSVEFEPGSSAYNDMVMFFQGTIPDMDTRTPVLLDKMVRFKYQNGKYRVVEGEIPNAYPD